MQERFRFRTWNLEKGKMHYDVEDTYDGISNNGIEHSNFSAVLEDDEYIVMQCTGLKDKNGKLIYEGDIIEWKKEKHIVIFDERNATFGIKISDVETHLFNDIHTPTRWIEVIGNIYENKELLKEQK